ncbi:hypothetical protein [Pantoea agglomerans]|uniref:hypothetical protein n=1 Tax=Enterobacter agglomerans TaxID=549 RepID=UPI002413CC8C|nr:hypothetical protein [Pantoea agglomerans]
MSEVNRYDIGGMADGGIDVQQFQDGYWVKYVDYAELKADLDALAAENAVRGEIIERLIGQYSAAGYHAVQNSLNPAQSLLYDAIQVLKQPATDAYLNSVRAQSISDALDSCTALCDTDCVMDAHDISYEDAELRSAGAAELRDELAAFASQLRAGKDGE